MSDIITPGDVVDLTVIPAGGGSRPDLNGRRAAAPGRKTIHLVVDGYRRRIPDRNTYNNLFRDWSGIVRDADVVNIPEREALSPTAVLAKAENGYTIYLLSNQRRRRIPGSSAMKKCHFDWSRIVPVPSPVLDTIPDGGDLP